MNPLRGIIFDCDGVLFESHRANLTYYNTILEVLDEAPVTADQTERAHLCHTGASIAVFAGLLGEDRVDEAMAVAAELDYRQFIPFMDPEPAMAEMLRALSEHYPLAVATNRGHSMAQIIEHFELGGYFKAVVTCKDVTRPKPYPDMLFVASQRLGLPVDQLLFVGDSSLDQAAARAAGIAFANYRGTLDADLRIDHHRQLVELFVEGK